MNEFKLTDPQKVQITELFNDETVDFNFVFSDLEYGLTEAYLSNDKASRKVIALEKSELLSDISKQASKLNKLIKRLDSKNQGSINAEIANRLSDNCRDNSIENCKEGCIDNLGDSCSGNCSIVSVWDALKLIDSLIITDVISNYSAFKSSFIKGRWGKSYLDHALDIICMAWPSSIKRELKITLNCKLVQFVCIVLGDNSTEKILKQIKSSAWYKQNYIDITGWQDKLR